MKPYVVKTPKFVQRLYPKRIWSFPGSKNEVYLTFDDGPIPEVTPWVLDELKNHQAKATFFCIGDNVRKHPELFRRIYSEGHAIGNHTYNHLKGSKTKTEAYLDNVLKAEEEMRRVRNGPTFTKASVGIKSEVGSIPGAQSRGLQSLFRPPYGKITQQQAEIIQKKGFKIVMWNVLSADFDTSISEEKCLKNVLGAIAPGSIIVFHDSLKAEKNLRYALPRVLNFISELKLNMNSIE